MSLTNSPFWFSSGATSAGGGGTNVYPYSLDQSLRFNDDDTAFLKRDITTTSNAKTWTWSAWVKRSNLTRQFLFGDGKSSALSELEFQADGTLYAQIYDGSAGKYKVSSRVFRDVGSWYHIVWRVDTTQATDADRNRVYINGERITDWSSELHPNLNSDSTINVSGNDHVIGAYSTGSITFDGYMAEVNFIDGTSLDPTSFGETIGGVWVPKEYDTADGAYSTNGFYLPFAQDASSGSSTFFDRSGSSALTFTNTSYYDIGSSDDFTIEAFIRPTSTMMSTYSYLLGNYGGASGPYMMLQFSPSANLFYFYTGNGTGYQFDYTAGDVVAGQWHHIAVNRNSGNLRFFLDGVQKDSTQADSTAWNNNDFKIGMAPLHAFDGDISNVRMVVGSAVYADGATITVPTSTLTNVTNTQLLALTTSTITEDASSNGVTGTLSGSGYFSSTLSPFADFNFYDDTSGNGNNFTANNLAASDVVPDSPTNNFCVFNSLDKQSNISLQEGGLKVIYTGVADIFGAYSTFHMTSGKWYAEFRVDSLGGSSYPNVGITKSEERSANFLPTTNVNVKSGATISEGTSGTSIDTFANGDILGVAFDADNGRIYFSKNGVFGQSQDPAAGTGAIFTGLTNSLGYKWGLTSYTNRHAIANFGQDSTFAGNETAGGNADDNGIGNFAYAPPSGFLAFCSSNLPEPAIGPQLASGQQADDYFETILYTGNGAVQHIGSGGAQHPIDVTTIANSIRFNDDDSAYLSRTPASAGNRKTFTLSTWIKPNSAATNYPPIFNAGTSAPDTVIRLGASNELQVVLENGGGGNSLLITNRILKDSSKWYHILVAVDTTNATADDRIKIYIDGVEETSFASRTNPSLNLDTNINNTVVHKIGAQRYASYWDGYMAEMYFIDGTALDPTSFGQYGSNGYWIPKAVSGLTFGDNGFYLDYSDNSTATALGTDSSGNTNNFSVTNLATTDQVGDSPTQNFATFDPNRPSGTTLTLSEGNLKAERTSSSFAQAYSTFEMTSGKWYAEFLLDTGNSGVGVIAGTTIPGTNRYMGQDSYTYGYYLDGRKVNNATYTTYGDSYTTAADGSGDVIGVLIDADNGNISFSKNGTVQNSGTPAFSGVKGPFKFAIASESNCFHIANFGQDDTFSGLKTSGSAGAADGNGYGKFYDTPPTGYLALVDDNIPQEGINSPDFVWVKTRSVASTHILSDSVRGANKQLFSNLTNAEQTDITKIQSFDANGFTVGTDASGTGSSNTNAVTYVAWNWKAGGKANTFNIDGTGYASIAASPISDGTLALTGLSANTTSGFSIGTYTGNATAGATIAHALGEIPEMVIVKRRTNARDWAVYHKDQSATPTNAYLLLNSTAAIGVGNTAWNNGTFTSSVFTIGSHELVNFSGDSYVFYAFRGIEGYSAVGKYVGNGSTDGTFVYTGFRPAFVLTKESTSTSGWNLRDNKRSPENVVNEALQADTTGSELTSGYDVDFLSNGFKLKTSLSDSNTSGQTYIYLAFAEAPFKYANAR